jgi:hypothetical protein
MADEAGLALAHFFQSGDVDLDVEVTRVGNDRAILHDFEMMTINDMQITGDGAEEIDDLLTLAQSRVTRPFTAAECKKYLHVEQCPSEP